MLLSSLGRHEEAIASYEKAIEIKFDYYKGWYDRGVALSALGRKEEAVVSYEKAIKIKFDYYEAWNNLGNVLSDLYRNEKAIESYKKAIKFRPDFDEAWYNLAGLLLVLGCKEEAVVSYEKAIEFNPDFHEAWNNLGKVLFDSYRNEKAIESYEKAIEFKFDLREAWNGRGNVLSALGRNEEAIVSCEKAIEFTPDSHKAWNNRSLAAANSRSHSPYPLPIVLNQRTAQLHLKHLELTQRGYKGQLASLTIGLLYCPADTHPLGHGYLRRKLGDAHRNYAKLQRSLLHSDWSKAIIAYNASLRCLTAIDHPAERLLTLQALIRTHIALNGIPEARHYQAKAIPLYNQLRQAARDKSQFERQHLSISRTEIDLILGENNPTRALEQAEFYKNRALTWILDDWETQSLSPTYAKMRSVLTSETAILYWHLSDDALTTFILTHDNPNPVVLEVDRYNAANKLTKLIEEYKKQYQSYRELKKDETAIDRANHPWRQQLPQWIETLKGILDITAIETHLTNIKTLILVPHRDLHLLPLHTLFPQTCTYLPSISTGITKRPPNQTPNSLLNIDDPTTSQAPLIYAQLESALIRALIPTHTKLNGTVNKQDTIVALTQPHSILHFSGHGTHDTHRPENSGLLLTDGLLNAKTIAVLNLSTYQLISLAACETGITGKDDQGEYIGLSSAFLKAKARTILSTLWQVDELSSLWLTIKFYQTYLSGESPANSLAIAQTWLQTLTYPELNLWLDQLQQLETLNTRWRKELNTEKQFLLEKTGRIDPTDRPYSHPYHWAGFTLIGQ